MERISAGVFVGYGRTFRLGEARRLGDLPEGALWTALPLDPVAGWLPPTRRGWHPIGARAVLETKAWAGLAVAEPTLHLQFQLGPEGAEGQAVEVLIDGRNVGRAVLERRVNDLRFPAPAVSAGDTATVELVFDPPLTRDGFRAPACMLMGFGLVDGAVEERTPAAGVPVREPETGVLTLGGSGLLVAPLDRPPDAVALELEARCIGEGSPAVSLSVLDRSGDVWLDRELAACGDEWRLESIPLTETESVSGTPGGPPDTLAIEILGASADDRFEIRAARLTNGVGDEAKVSRSAASGTEFWTPPEPERGRRSAETAGQGPPDVLLIVLDAARASHFGFAGYARDTTPNLDRLAAESLVFARAYAECPNTSCSIPNLISGIPFMNLGTVFHGKKIPEEVTTLAEYLKPLGYRTVSFSANPNNAVSRNSHQGFDYFERVAGAHYQARRAVEEIERQPADQPLYLQLHFLPPHQPYMPSAEFDLFTDPAYEGVVHPRLGLRQYSAGLRAFDRADLDELVALYDGNLRMVDDAVEEVLEALRRAGRWGNSLVLVTSDHGEAFGEHDTFQHNSTVYEEMLHVPFVLRLPGGEPRPAVDTGALASLSDVVPTVLGVLGIEPRPEVWGVDLLAPRPPGAEPRFLFHRTFHANRPLLAIRDTRWKAITGQGLRRPELYDLARDPDELDNLVASRPAHFSGLALRLRDFLVDWEERVPQSVEDVELSAEEVKLLRSLGYVE